MSKVALHILKTSTKPLLPWNLIDEGVANYDFMYPRMRRPCNGIHHRASLLSTSLIHSQTKHLMRCHLKDEQVGCSIPSYTLLEVWGGKHLPLRRTMLIMNSSKC